MINTRVYQYRDNFNHNLFLSCSSSKNYLSIEERLTQLFMLHLQIWIIIMVIKINLIYSYTDILFYTSYIIFLEIK